jgi:hypothetical protein
LDDYLSHFTSPNVATIDFMIIGATSCSKNVHQFVDTLVLNFQKFSMVKA